MEQKLKILIGDLIIQVLTLQHQLEELKKTEDGEANTE